MIETLKNIDRITFINYLILFYAFVISFPIEIIRPVAIMMILLWLTDRKSKIDLPETKIFLFFGIFLFYICLSYIWSDASLKEAWSYVKRYWYFIPAFVIFKYLKKENFNLLITSFLSGIFISEILSYGNFFGLWQIGLGNPTMPVVFMQHTLYGVFLSLTSLFLLFKLVYEPKDKLWFFNLFFFITVTTNIFINSGRTGYFTFLLTLITVVIIINFKDKIKLLRYLFYSISFLVLIFFSAYNLSDNFKNRTTVIASDIKNISNENYDTPIGARWGFWIITKDIFIENPILGTGIGNVNNVKNEIIDNKYGEEYNFVRWLQHFHNIHLETIATYGLVGYLLFISILVQIILFQIKDPIIRSLKYILVISFIFSGLAENVFYLSQPLSLFSLILGIILAKYKFEDKNIK